MSDEDEKSGRECVRIEHIQAHRIKKYDKTIYQHKADRRTQKGRAVNLDSEER